MGAIEISSRLAREIGRALQSRATGPRIADSVHRALADVILAQSEWNGSADDAALRKRILAALRESRDGRDLIDFTVQNGIVEMRGVLSSEREREQLLETVRAIPGVDELHDHMICIDFASGAVFRSAEEQCAG